MGGRLDGRVALVTGAGGGIGEATARLFWEEGAAVALVDRDEEACRRAAEGIAPRGDRTLALAADLAREAEAERAVAAAVDRFGRLDVLACVAGVRAWGPVAEATPERLARRPRRQPAGGRVLRRVRRRGDGPVGGGSIVNVSSANALVGRRGMGPYDASKAGVLALTRTLACEHAGQGIRVNAVCPGPTLTQFHVRRRAARDGVSAGQAEAALRAAAVDNLLKRQAEPREIAWSILFLACDESSYMTGATLMVDGGLSV